jgi:hypothetical protein
MSLVREVEKVSDVMAVMQLQSLSKSVVQDVNPTKWNIRSRQDVKHSAQHNWGCQCDRGQVAVGAQLAVTHSLMQGSGSTRVL